MKIGNAAKRLVIEIVGWLLVLVGLAALVLPGPGLLALFAGMAILATRYEWAARRVEPIKKAALKAAHDSVSSWSHIIASCVGVGVLIAIGIACGLQLPTPGWWPLPEKLWLPGGWGVGASMIVSALIAGGMILYSYLNFRSDK